MIHANRSFFFSRQLFFRAALSKARVWATSSHTSSSSGEVEPAPPGEAARGEVKEEPCEVEEEPCDQSDATDDTSHETPPFHPPTPPLAAAPASASTLVPPPAAPKGPLSNIKSKLVGLDSEFHYLHVCRNRNVNVVFYAEDAGTRATRRSRPGRQRTLARRTGDSGVRKHG